MASLRYSMLSLSRSLPLSTEVPSLSISRSRLAIASLASASSSDRAAALARHSFRSASMLRALQGKEKECNLSSSGSLGSPQPSVSPAPRLLLFDLSLLFDYESPCKPPSAELRHHERPRSAQEVKLIPDICCRNQLQSMRRYAGGWAGPNRVCRGKARGPSLSGRQQTGSCARKRRGRKKHRQSGRTSAGSARWGSYCSRGFAERTVDGREGG